MQGTVEVTPRGEAIIVVACPRCGSRYYKHALPELCLLAFCEHPLGAKVTMQVEHIPDPKQFKPTRYWS